MEKLIQTNTPDGYLEAVKDSITESINEITLRRGRRCRAQIMNNEENKRIAVSVVAESDNNEEGLSRSDFEEIILNLQQRPEFESLEMVIEIYHSQYDETSLHSDSLYLSITLPQSR